MRRTREEKMRQYNTDANEDGVSEQRKIIVCNRVSQVEISLTCVYHINKFLFNSVYISEEGEKNDEIRKPKERVSQIKKM